VMTLPPTGRSPIQPRPLSGAVEEYKFSLLLSYTESEAQPIFLVSRQFSVCKPTTRLKSRWVAVTLMKGY
jgi:hypothetical protein